jgi:hypothetical protein
MRNLPFSWPDAKVDDNYDINLRVKTKLRDDAARGDWQTHILNKEVVRQAHPGDMRIASASQPGWCAWLWANRPRWFEFDG